MNFRSLFAFVTVTLVTVVHAAPLPNTGTDAITGTSGAAGGVEVPAIVYTPAPVNEETKELTKRICRFFCLSKPPPHDAKHAHL